MVFFETEIFNWFINQGQNDYMKCPFIYSRLICFHFDVEFPETQRIYRKNHLLHQLERVHLEYTKKYIKKL